MKKILFFTLFFILFLCAPGLTQTVIKAEVDKNLIAMDDTLTYKLVITSTLKDIPAPEFPDFKGFDVLSQARSSSISFAKNQAKTLFVYACVLSPKEKGKFIIAPSKVKIKDSTISSESFEIQVTEAKESLRPKPQTTQPQPDKPQVTL